MFLNKFNQSNVDLPRIELGTVQCECTGMPFTYRPVGVLRVELRPQSPEPCILPLYYTPKNNFQFSNTDSVEDYLQQSAQRGNEVLK